MANLMSPIRPRSSLVCRAVILWLVTGLSGLALVSGCTILAQPVRSIQESLFAERSTVHETQQQQHELPPADFEQDTLYNLLVAEMAAYNQRFDLTLSHYLQEARKTRDPGLVARAYDVASVLRVRQVATEMAELWLSIEPDNSEAVKAHAVEQVWAGDIDAAMPAMIDVKRKTGEAPFFFVATQAVELSEDARDQLIANYRTWLKNWPDDRSLKIGLALLIHQQGDLDNALKQLELMIAAGESDATVVRLKGLLLIELKRSEQAVTVLREGLDKYPDDLRIRLLYGRLLLKDGDLTGAQREFEVLVAQQPQNPELLVTVGLISMENGMPGQAGLYFYRLAEIPGQADVANFYLGRLAQQMDDWKEGRKYFLKVEPGSQFLPAYVALTRMLADREYWDLMADDLEKARKSYPDYAPELYLIEGEVMEEQRSYDKANGIFNRALIKYPDNIELLYARAMLAERFDDLRGLENDVRKILQKEPDHAAALNALGYTLADRGLRLAEAKELIIKAYKIQPDDASIMDSMGWIEYRLGNHNLALVYLRQAYKRFEDAEVAAHLGEVLWALGLKKEAVKIWSEALERQPDSEVLRSTVERLRVTW